MRSPALNFLPQLALSSAPPPPPFVFAAFLSPVRSLLSFLLPEVTYQLLQAMFSVYRGIPIIFVPAVLETTYGRTKMTTTYMDNTGRFLSFLLGKRRMSKAWLLAAERTLPRAPSALSLELFLCCLHVTFGNKFLRQIDNAEEFFKMQKELLPEGKPGMLSRLLVRQGRDIPPGVEAMFVANEERLSRIFWNTFRIANALKIRTDGLPEFITALCLDEEAVRHLKTQRGFMPANYLDATFSIGSPHYGNGTSRWLPASILHLWAFTAAGIDLPRIENGSILSKLPSVFAAARGYHFAIEFPNALG
jgi:hypothetical protein